MSFPDEEGLRGAWLVTPRLAWRRFDCAFEAGSEASVDLVVPATAHTPPCPSVGVQYFTTYLECGGSFPAALFEVEGANFASCPVFDFHKTIAVYGRRTCNDTNDGHCNLFPRVQFFASGSGPKLQEPCP